jgi:tetraacyldisaccharide 4'-kinase
MFKHYLQSRTWETYFLNVIKGRKSGIIPSLLRPILLLLSWCYAGGIWLRNRAYDMGWMRKYSPPVPLVISVGNIVAGGTGKTPVTLMLAKEFYAQTQIAILSRGYRSEAEKLTNPVWISKGHGPILPAHYCGDEPYLLAKNLPKAYVFVGCNRHKASNMAAKAGARVILLDDGMQHRALARDLDVVVIDAIDPFGLGHYLPRGLLRESLDSLKRADLIVINHAVDEARFKTVGELLGRYTQSPRVGVRMEVDQVMDFNDLPYGDLKDKRVGLFCGIAHPEYFRNTLKSSGAIVVDEMIVPDHMPFDMMRLEEFALRCKGNNAEVLVCTEKDRVKFSGLLDLILPVVWLKMKLSVVYGEDNWKTFTAKAIENLKRRL